MIRYVGHALATRFGAAHQSTIHVLPALQWQASNVERKQINALYWPHSAPADQQLLADFCLSLPAAMDCELHVEFECNGSWASSRLFSLPFLQLVLNEPHFSFDRRDGELLYRVFSGSSIHQLEYSHQVGFSRFKIFKNL